MLAMEVGLNFSCSTDIDGTATTVLSCRTCVVYWHQPPPLGKSAVHKAETRRLVRKRYSEEQMWLGGK